MKLSNPRPFAIIGEENKIGLALEDNTSVIMCISLEWGFSTLLKKIVPRLELLMPKTNSQGKSFLQL